MSRIRSFIINLIGESRRAKVFFLASFILVFFLSLLYVHHVWLESNETTKQSALKFAAVAQAGFSGTNLQKLDVNDTDLSKKEYSEIKESLQQIVAEYDNVRFAYIFILKEEMIYFIADSESPESKDYSPPGQEFTEATMLHKQPFLDGKPTIFRATDRWGTWITVLNPMKDHETGEVTAVFGFDFTVETWYERAVTQTIEAVVMSFCLFLVYLSLLAVIRTNIAIRREKTKLAEVNEKLSKEEELFRTIYEQSPVGISVIMAGKKNYNSMYEKIVGWSEEFLKTNGWECITHPEDLEMEQELCRQFLFEKKTTFQMNKRYIKPDGSVVWATITATPLKVSSQSETDYMCIIEDITERVKAERDLQENERSYGVLLSNLPGMAYRCKYDTEWTMLFASEGCLDLTGYPASNLINNKNLAYNDLISPKYQDYLWEKWIKAVNEKRKLSEEYEIITASGDAKWVYEQGQAVYDESGNVVALEGLIVDITDRKRKEDEIQYLNNHDYLTGIYNRRFLEMIKGRMDREDFLPLSVIIGDINGLKLVNDALGHAEGDILIKETAKIMRECARKDDIAARTGGDEFMILMPFTDKASANDRMNSIKEACERYNRNLSNEAYSINVSLGFATKETGRQSLDETIKLAEDYMYKRKLLEHKSSHSVILASIKATMHEKSHETQEHAERLTHLAKEIGKRLKLSQQELDELELVATLHDIGKVGIDDRILNKPGKLTEEEWVEMKKHSEIGYRIAISSPDLVAIADYILSLHERWDGTGYPQGIGGEEIPLLSRIVSIVDAYDAMTEDRSYRKAMAEEEAVNEIRKNAGSQFDPKLVKVFLEKVLPGNY